MNDTSSTRHKPSVASRRTTTFAGVAHSARTNEKAGMREGGQPQRRDTIHLRLSAGPETDLSRTIENGLGRGRGAARAAMKVLEETSHQGRLVARLARALRAERRRGRIGHASYDLNRHIKLLQTWRVERAKLSSPDGDRPR